MFIIKKAKKNGTRQKTWPVNPVASQENNSGSEAQLRIVGRTENRFRGCLADGEESRGLFQDQVNLTR
jgi:hypothetical protein